MATLSSILGSNFQGSQGTQGVQGITGSGSQGTQGIQGIQGTTGPIAGSDSQIKYNNGGVSESGGNNPTASNTQFLTLEANSGSTFDAKGVYVAIFR